MKGPLDNKQTCISAPEEIIKNEELHRCGWPDDASAGVQGGHGAHGEAQTLAAQTETQETQDARCGGHGTDRQNESGEFTL